MRTLGLLGKDLSYSFSAKYFTQKFIQEGITNTQYLNFELENLSDFKNLIQKFHFSGLNVTMPYKESIIPFLDELNETARIIGAVNTIHFLKGKLIGYNTDYIGFMKSIKPLLNGRKKAIILGDGGSAKAIKYVLNQLHIEYKTVSRNTSFNYSHINKQITGYYDIIINTTPLGSYSRIDEFPKIPYKNLTNKHLLFDLIYNPNESKFLMYGKANKAQIKNGLEMLKIQAKESWKIWNT